MNDKLTQNNTFLIIGAGPAGLLMGIQLIKQGFNVQIVERQLKQLRPVCGEYLSPQGVEYLRKLDLYHTVKDFEPITGMDIFSSKGTKVKTSFPKKQFGLAINRLIFQERLAENFNALGGIVHYGNDLKKVNAFTDYYEVETSELVIKANYVIGADGRQSKLAKICDLKTAEPMHRKLALHCYLKPKFTLPNKGQMHILNDGSYIGINPISADEVNFSIVTTHDAIKNAKSLKDLINFWIEKSPALKNQFHLLQDEEIKTTSPLTRNTIDVAKDGIALIGDASGFIDPLTGEGITTAIKTTYILTEEIDKCSNISDAFKNYSDRRKKDFLEKEKLNRGFQKVIHSPTISEFIALGLNISENLRNTFIGVVGNIYSPTEGLRALFHLYLKERY